MKVPSLLGLVRRHWSLGLVLLLGTGISSLVFQIKQDAVADRQRATLAEASPQYVRLLKWELDAHVDTLASLRELVQAAPGGDRDRFTSFSKRTFPRAPGLLSLHWIRIVPGEGREAFEARAREKGLAGFSLSAADEAGRPVPVGKAERYYPVYFSETQGAEWARPGFDLGSRDLFRESVRRAETEKRLVAVPDRALGQEVVSDLTVLLVLPVLAGGDDSAEVTGLVAARVDVGGLCRRLLAACRT